MSDQVLGTRLNLKTKISLDKSSEASPPPHPFLFLSHQPHTSVSWSAKQNSQPIVFGLHKVNKEVLCHMWPTERNWGHQHVFSPQHWNSLNVAAIFPNTEFPVYFEDFPLCWLYINNSWVARQNKTRWLKQTDSFKYWILVSHHSGAILTSIDALLFFLLF